MTAVLVASVAGALGARLLWLAARPVFGVPALARTNWRGRTVPTAAGVLLPVVAVVVEAVRAVVDAAGDGPDGGTVARLLVVAAAFGFALLGAVDDVLGTPDQRGFRGHLGALARGHVTTGALKLLGGAAVAVVVVAPLAGLHGPNAMGGSVGRLLADAALVALCANLGNLLDRAPGRVVKAAGAAFVVLVVALHRRADLDGVAVVTGASFGLLLDDLRERLMLGDAGANAIGAVVGMGVVLAAAPGVRTAVLAVVAVLNLAGELVSFSRVIDAVPPLRALDKAGRCK